MTFYALSALINGLASSALGLFVYFRNKRGSVNRCYGLTTVSIAVWSYCYFFWQISTQEAAALFWCRALMVGAIFIPPTYLHFVISFLGLYKEKRKIIILNYIISSVFFIFNFTPLFVKSVSPKLSFRYWPDAGIAYISFLMLVYFNCMAYAIISMFREYKKETGIKKTQIKYVLLGAFVGFGGGATNYPLWYNIPIPPLGNILVSVGIGIMAYGILRYRLMDISVAITRTGTFVAVYTLVIGLPFGVAIWLKSWLVELLGPGWWMLPLGLMAVLATVGPFIYIYVERKAEARLLKEQKRYQETLKQASLGMTRIRNLRKLLDLIAHIVTKTVKISYVAIYLYNKETSEYVLQISRDKGRMSIPRLAPDNPLISWLANRRDPLIYEEVKRQAQDYFDSDYRLLEENMLLLTASVVIPSFLEDSLTGFIVLGDKMSGKIYTPEDLNVFQVLASQAALAIENAQFYEEAKEMQEQIGQAEKMATIGTMADGLSHQINNRFYALSLIAGDTIDTIKMTDASKCTPEMQQMIKDVNRALERIQSNVIQGGEVVKGILKYTRKGEEGFVALNLDQIIDGTLDMVQYKVKLSEIDIIRDYSKDIPKIKANLVQLEEVFFNFIDNAYDAIVERRNTLKEEGYRGRITISAMVKDGALEIIVEDNGMGMHDDNLKKIFTPFFTTKTSSRRGTGLGLYVIKRIITDIHKGKINFESGYKVGTRFILELPVASE